MKHPDVDCCPPGQGCNQHLCDLPMRPGPDSSQVICAECGRAWRAVKPEPHRLAMMKLSANEWIWRAVR